MLNVVSSKKVLVGIAAATAIMLTSAAWAGPRGGGNAGGSSGAHISDQGEANTNGPTAADRDKGAARAEDHRSEQGAAHTKSSDHTQSGKTKAAKQKKEKP